MPTLLDEIVVRKREQLLSQKARWPQETLRDRALGGDRDFVAALRARRPAYILECKKASPSQGLIRDDFDLPTIARRYAPYASAISVLTEPDYFQGSLEFLAEVRQSAPQPLLCKDFIIDPWQVWAARAFGADAILLILAILDDATLLTLFELANQLGLGVLAEVSNRDEQQRAIRMQLPVVGINNRNLRDMSIDLNTTRTLAEGLAPNTIVISESGYHHHHQVRHMADVADGFLVGSSLMAQPNLAVAVKRLIFGDHKVCGLTTPEAARAANEFGAVYGGAIFASGSPRQIRADEVDHVFPEEGLLRIGVFQNASPDAIASAVQTSQLHGVQLHGRETIAETQAVADRLGTDTVVWKALPVAAADQFEAYLRAGADRIVVDATHQGQFGGTGKPFDWTALPLENRERIMLAGGLGAANIAEALQLGCAGLDFNSSLESSIGRKSPERIRDLFQLIRDIP